MVAINAQIFDNFCAARAVCVAAAIAEKTTARVAVGLSPSESREDSDAGAGLHEARKEDVGQLSKCGSFGGGSDGFVWQFF